MQCVITHPSKNNATLHGLRFEDGVAEFNPETTTLFDAHPGKTLEEILALFTESGCAISWDGKAEPEEIEPTENEEE